MKRNQWIPLIVSVLISLGAGALSRLLSGDSMGIYSNLYKPPLSPPGWVFPVVWTILYILMGIASYLVFVSNSPNKQKALKLYFVQLVMNVGWSILFFGMNAYLLAFTGLLLLWYFVYLTMKEFYKINPLAGKLLVPYLLWLTFAGYLNLVIALHYNL
jgi:tryptophan-rich sensory protein